MIRLPYEFKQRMMHLLGDMYPEYERALTESPARAFRVNTEKISVEEFERISPFQIQKIPYVENGYFFDFDKIGNHPFHHAGMIYVQEPAAMMPAECIPISPDWKILDLCAAPGGKSSQLKNKLGENGLLLSNEIVPSRCKILASNIERLGLRNVVITSLSPDKIANSFKSTFDMIMVDAPCSGEGMFRKEEIAIEEWSPENVKRCAARQADILDNAAIALKNGGYIVYSTCTFSLEENEMTLDSFISRHPEFELVPVNEEIIKQTASGIAFDGCKCKNIEYARRFYPHLSKGEGQFMAVIHSTLPPTPNDASYCTNKSNSDSRYIKKRGSSNAKSGAKDTRTALSGTSRDAVISFLSEALREYDESCIRIHNGVPVYFSPCVAPELSESLSSIAFSVGIPICEIKKNYVIPHHSFFMAMGSSFKRSIDLEPDSEELKKYLHGEEFNASLEDGWAAVTVCGCTLGGAKIVNGIAKNHYPKGLRIKG